METDPTRRCELLVGLPDVHILGGDDQVNGFVCIYIESKAERPGCTHCGVFAQPLSHTLELADVEAVETDELARTTAGQAEPAGLVPSAASVPNPVVAAVIVAARARRWDLRPSLCATRCFLAPDLVTLAQRSERTEDPIVRQRIAEAHTHDFVGKVLAWRVRQLKRF